MEASDVILCNLLVVVRGSIGGKNAAQLLLDRSMMDSNAIMV